MENVRQAAGRSADVIVLGAGLGGAVAASVIAAQGRRVVLIDQRASFPACFKAEKIEAHQADLFRKFGLMDLLLPHAGKVRHILDAHDGSVMRAIDTEQYGITYHDMVNAIRAKLPSNVQFKLGRVREIATSEDEQRVTTADGGQFSARLLVVASGTNAAVQDQLRLRRDVLVKEQSLCFGFTLGRRDKTAFPFESVTCHPGFGVTRMAYLTLFPILSSLRANLFVYWSAREEQTRRFLQEPVRELAALLPHLTHLTGEFEIVSKVESFMIELYKMENYRQPGVVLVGDAFQSVCPTTATGVSKILNDVDVLGNECLPHWFATPGMSVEKIARFYDSQQKQDVDRRSLESADYQRRIAVDTSLSWNLRRLRRHGQMQLAAWRNYFTAGTRAA